MDIKKVAVREYSVDGIEQNQITVNDSLGKPLIEFNKSVPIWRKEAGRFLEKYC